MFSIIKKIFSYLFPKKDKKHAEPAYVNKSDSLQEFNDAQKTERAKKVENRSEKTETEPASPEKSQIQ